MAHKHPTLDPGTKLDRFRLERLIGTGAFGQVWTAIDEGGHGFRKRVALKILAETTNERRIEALMHEARLCGALNHPNIIDVYGVMQVPGASFIIMEFVEGEPLSALWKDLEFLGVRFPRSITLDIGIGVCEALHHAWMATDSEGQPLRIVHRDLKPANVMVSDRGMVKVGDFGIAKASAIDPSTTHTGKLKGTPSYLAPEVWQGKRDFRPSIDLWSLGVILWEMVAGKRFFGRANMAEIFELVQHRTPEDEAEQLRDWFPEIVGPVRRLLQRDANDREQSALKVAETLRGIRQKIGASGDLLQFSRLVRAGRVEPENRQGSLVALPALPVDASDWTPLIAVAAGSPSPPTAPSAAEILEAPVKLGPSTGEAGLPDPQALTRSGYSPRLDAHEDEPARAEAAPPPPHPQAIPTLAGDTAPRVVEGPPPKRQAPSEPEAPPARPAHRVTASSPPLPARAASMASPSPASSPAPPDPARAAQPPRRRPEPEPEPPPPPPRRLPPVWAMVVIGLAVLATIAMLAGALRG